MSLFDPDIKIESDKSQVVPVIVFLVVVGLILACGFFLVDLIKAIYA